jgi:probable HAF family extracellular repeat protein
MSLRLANIKSRIFRCLAPPRLRPPRSAACYRPRLAVEPLEDRCLLSSYSITDIGPITALTSYVAPANPLSGINNASTVQVAGEGANQLAYVWDSIHGMQDIGTVGKETNSKAVSINNAGQVVGVSWSYIRHDKHGVIYYTTTEDGFSWTSSSGMTSLGSSTFPTGINSSGEITGDKGAEAALRNGKQWIQLGILPGGTSSAALGINDYGQVVGYSQNDTNSFFHGFLWTPSSPNSTSGTMTDLGTIFSSPGGSWASAINSQGWVTGRSDDMNASGAGHAYVWVPSSTNGTAGSWTDLGTLAVNPSPGLSQSEGNAINGSGVVVGDANPAGATSQKQFVAVVWQPGTNGSYTISDLNNLIPSGTGWTLTRADAVNDQGQIVVETAQGHALLLTPTTTPSAPALSAASARLLVRSPLSSSSIDPSAPSVALSLSQLPAMQAASATPALWFAQAPLFVPSLASNLPPAGHGSDCTDPVQTSTPAADQVFASLDTGLSFLRPRKIWPWSAEALMT